MGFDESARVEVHLDAGLEQVWQALTDAGALAAWYWPQSLRPAATSDPVVGGGFGINADGMGFSGEYVELDRPRRIVQAWRWKGDDRDSRVTIELLPAGAGTDLVVVHDRIDAATAVDYQAAWESCLARLPGYLA